MEKLHPWTRIITSNLDALVTALVDDANKFSLEVSNIKPSLVFLGVMVSIANAYEPPGVDTVELVVNQAFDIPLELLGLLATLLLI